MQVCSSCAVANSYACWLLQLHIGKGLVSILSAEAPLRNALVQGHFTLGVQATSVPPQRGKPAVTQLRLPLTINHTDVGMTAS
jgi:hypothetical protein